MLYTQYSRTSVIPLIVTESHPDRQKIRRVGFFFENRPHWQFEMENIFTNGSIRLHINLLTNKTSIHISFYVFDNWRG
jgi:hypothetical protein